MLIRSQNGEILAPLEIGFLMVMEDDNKFLIIQVPLVPERLHSGTILSKYDSMETALKVMDDIQRAYMDSERVYMMPMAEEYGNDKH